MAIEMVYIPQGPFFVGSGGGETDAFYKYPTTTNPYQITSEAVINMGKTTNYLYNSLVGDSTLSIPAAFPKGYNAFYCMKYEITQDQYVAFLNKLTTTQAVNRQNLESSHRNLISGINGVYSTANPYVACGYLDARDIAAYLDWAALRPMTELEFEKAARGPITPIANEYAWGTTNFTPPTGITNSGLSNEIPANAAANSNINNASSVPLRVGCFGQGVNTREAVGAGFYGVMDLTGNIHETAVPVGSTLGRAYTGNHGNGGLSTTGYADVALWSLYDNNGSCRRGGSSGSGQQTQARTSDRLSALTPSQQNSSTTGGRGVRTAP